MPPREQTRLQVLNSLLAEHITLDQAATLLGVSERHTRRILAAYREGGSRRPGPRTSGPQGPQRDARARCNCCGPPGSHQVRRGQPHPSQRVAERTGAQRHWQVHPAAYSGQRRTEQSAEQAAAPAPGAPPAHAPGGHADPGGRQPSPVVGRPGAAVHAADRRGRCHRHGGRRPLLPAGGRPQLLPADPEPAGWAMALLRAGRCSRSRSGRVSDSMAAELTAAWRRCSRFSRVGGPPGQAVEQLCGRLSRAAGQSPEVVGLERLVEGLLSREHVGRKYLFHLHHVGFQQCHLGLNPVLQDPPGGAPGLVLASGGIGNHYPPSSAGNRPGPPGQSPCCFGRGVERPFPQRRPASWPGWPTSGSPAGIPGIW